MIPTTTTTKASQLPPVLRPLLPGGLGLRLRDPSRVLHASASCLSHARQASATHRTALGELLACRMKSSCVHATLCLRRLECKCLFGDDVRSPSRMRLAGLSGCMMSLVVLGISLKYQLRSDVEPSSINTSPLGGRIQRAWNTAERLCELCPVKTHESCDRIIAILGPY